MNKPVINPVLADIVSFANGDRSAQDAEKIVDQFAHLRHLYQEDLKGIPADLSLLPEPERFYLIIKPVGLMRTSSGGIIIPDVAIDNQEWTHCTAVVCRVGKAVYRGKRFEDMGLHHTDGPKVGSLIQVNPRNPKRFYFDRELYMYVPDDGFDGRIRSDVAHRITYKL